MKIVLAVILVCCLQEGQAWRLWTSTEGGPKARRGHTLNIFRNRTTNKEYIILFGGRSNDNTAFHQPKTFEIVSKNGRLQFSTYDEKPVYPDSEINNTCNSGVELNDNDTCANQNVVDDEKYQVPVGVYYNDIWVYDLDCERYADDGCINEAEGWSVVDAGARLGGCYNWFGKEICTHPTERYGHNAQVVNNEFLAIFGGFSHFCEDFCDDLWIYIFGHGSRWQKLNPVHSPGKRWRSASALIESTIFLFGGHRLWHGFSSDNNRYNHYLNTNQYPKGGYMSDFWKLNLSSCLCHDRCATFEEKVQMYTNCEVRWEEINSKKNCTDYSLYEDGSLKPGSTWEERNDKVCTTIWPTHRAAHALTAVGDQLYMFGGYRTFFPYPNTQSYGSGSGTSIDYQTAGFEKYTPYPTYNYFLDDLWRYDTKNGYWHIVASPSIKKPVARMEHVFLRANEVLILFAGYTKNTHLNDLWYFELKTNRWIEKESFVHAQYPPECIDNGWVSSYPTAGSIVDGQYGRASEHFAINFTRRRRPGWDGCRDRVDNREDLPWQLQWEKPMHRSHHAAVYSEKHEFFLMYGGHGYFEEKVATLGNTFQVETKGDFWEYRIHQCPHNCSDHGECRYGFCFCNDGYYGIDCSNISCPGDFCYYNETTHMQVCKHCCSGPHVHYDGEPYVANVEKESCSHTMKGTENGLCDGYGKCQCRPPFIGLDCSMKDCPNKCSNHGICNEEYPVSRCICDPGYRNEDCSFKECLNNCSYPRGECHNGECICSVILDPYNRTRIWRKYGGMDCSFIIPYADANTLKLEWSTRAISMFIIYYYALL